MNSETVNIDKIDLKQKSMEKMGKRKQRSFRHTTSFYRNSKRIEQQIRDKSASILKLQKCRVSVVQNNTQSISDVVMVTRSSSASQQDVFASKESTSLGGNNVYLKNPMYSLTRNIYVL